MFLTISCVAQTALRNDNSERFMFESSTDRSRFICREPARSISICSALSTMVLSEEKFVSATSSSSLKSNIVCLSSQVSGVCGSFRIKDVE